MVPAFLLPKFDKGRERIWQNFIANQQGEISDAQMRNFYMDLLTSLQNRYLEETDVGKIPDERWGIAALWASQANSLPISTWTITYILNNPAIREKVLEELKQVNFEKDEAGNYIMSYDKVNAMNYLRACVNEGMRIIPPSMVTRRATKDIPITTKDGKSYVIPQGDTLCVSVWFTHHDPKNYEDPETFNPDRFTGGKYPSLFQFTPFGKGINECPGRLFAIQEMLVFIALFFLHFGNAQLLSGIPSADLQRKVGSPAPKDRISIRLE